MNRRKAHAKLRARVKDWEAAQARADKRNSDIQKQHKPGSMSHRK